MITESDFARYDPSQKVINIKDLTTSPDRYVYLFETSNNKYVLKKAKEEKIYMLNERKAKIIINDKDLPIAKTLYSDDDITIENFIEGELLTSHEPLSVYREIGQCTERFHSIKTVGFGFMKEVGIGKYNTEKDYILECAEINNPIFKTHPLLKSIDIPYIVQKNIEVFDSKQSVFIHGDLHCDNVLVNDGKLAGIIDFGDSMAGPPEHDLGRFCTIINSNIAWQSFLEGYGKDFDRKKFLMYAFLRGTKSISLGSIEEGSESHKNYLEFIKELI